MLEKEGEAEQLVKRIGSLDAPIMPQGPTIDDDESSGEADKSKNALLDMPNVDPKATVSLSNKNDNTPRPNVVLSIDVIVCKEIHVV
ncbi:unnamed protein product [Strongylus vulgaris]|uniref:Uncharacterized protein n=1 Tax=Strongylus vulgaris TaxID=40348 RepID=A0A3P7IY97_STRVU|nr:unnamed protein product [Strongylus vulgaris]